MSTKPNVLLVDDSPTLLTVGRYALENAGYQTLKAMDGAEALDILLTWAPLVVFLDDLMPRMSGFDVLHHVENAGILDRHAFIIWTAHYNLKDDPELLRLQQRHTIPILEKPVKADSLVAQADAAAKRLYAQQGTRPR